MEYNEDFARLEQFVERLIDSYNQLKNYRSPGKSKRSPG
jgi:hypothetical protein